MSKIESTFINEEGTSFTLTIGTGALSGTFQLGSPAIRLELLPLGDEESPWGYSKQLRVNMLYESVLQYLNDYVATESTVELQREGVVIFKGKTVPYSYSEEIISPPYFVQLDCLCDFTLSFADGYTVVSRCADFIEFLDSTVFDIYNTPGSLTLSSVEILPRFLDGYNLKQYFQDVSTLFGGVWFQHEGSTSFHFLDAAQTGPDITKMFSPATLRFDAKPAALQIQYYEAERFFLDIDEVNVSGLTDGSENEGVGLASCEYYISDLVYQYQPGKFSRSRDASVTPVAPNYQDTPTIQVIFIADDGTTNYYFDADSDQWLNSSYTNELNGFEAQAINVKPLDFPGAGELVTYSVTSLFYFYVYTTVNDSGVPLGGGQIDGLAYDMDGGKVSIYSDLQKNYEETVSNPDGGKGTFSKVVKWNNYHKTNIPLRPGRGESYKELSQWYNIKSSGADLFETYGKDFYTPSGTIQAYIDSSFKVPEAWWEAVWPAEVLSYDYGQGSKNFRLGRAEIDMETNIMRGRLIQL